jgi:hypothetical protein
VTGTVSGTVKDPQGAAIPGASVSLVSESQGTAIAPVVTNINGDFVIPNIAAGTYTLRAFFSGLNPASASIRVGARVEQHGHGVDGAGPGGPHDWGDAILLGVIGWMTIGQETPDGVGGIGAGRGGDRTPGGRAAGARCDQGRAHSHQQHEVTHDDLRGR